VGGQQIFFARSAFEIVPPPSQPLRRPCVYLYRPTPLSIGGILLAGVNSALLHRHAVSADTSSQQTLRHCVWLWRAMSSYTYTTINHFGRHRFWRSLYTCITRKCIVSQNWTFVTS